ncbi:hypothetical protein FTX61_06390 [Nitriliruptoraceae bacterium ZYF776]|nr:hypothetical protein [Profundirhabdus halotolerans]
MTTLTAAAPSRRSSDHRDRLVAVIAGVAAVKSVDLLVTYGAAVWLLLGSWLALGALATRRWPTAGMAVIGAAALATNLTPAYRNHLALLVWVVVALLLFPDPQHERLALRWQLTIMYGFAAVTKVWPDWLSGAALEARTWIGPSLPEPMLLGAAWGTVAVEAVLAVAVWLRWRGWLYLAVAVHLGFLLFTHRDPIGIARLAIFGTLSIAVWLRAARPAEATA